MKTFLTLLELEVHLPELDSELMVREGAEAQVESSFCVVRVISAIQQ